MTAGEALKEIQGLAAANRIRFTAHSAQRASQRGATFQDVRTALINATECLANANGTWKVTGPDLDGDDLTCIVAIEDAAVIITLF